MTGTRRRRYRSGNVESGPFNINGSGSRSRTNLDGFCEDVIGNKGGNNYLNLITQTRSGSRYIEGPENNPWANAPMPIPYPSPYWDGLPSHESYVNRLLSTGPSVPNLALPVALFELREVPRMLRHAGDLIHKLTRPSSLNPAYEAASSTLAYQFGWKPLIEDTLKMCNFADIVAKRQRLLDGAHSKRGVRQSRRLGTIDRIDRGVSLLNSTHGRFIYQAYTDRQVVDTWGSTRWQVRDPNQYGKKANFQDAFRSALGLNAGHIPLEIWKVLPWSWAIDWFADISNVIGACGNLVDYRASDVNIMRRVRIDRVWSAGYTSGGRITQGNSTIDQKMRTVHQPIPSISLRLPFLDSFKLSIVASMSTIAVMRR